MFKVRKVQRWFQAFMVLAIIAALFPMPIHAQSQQPSTGIPYTLIGVGSGKCMDVKDWSKDNGATIQIWECHFGDNQIWVLESAGSGYYRIKSKHSGKCLDVKGASKDDKARIQLYSCHGKENQQFKFEIQSDGTYQIKARHSGKCIDVQGASTSNGATLQQYRCHGKSNQRWRPSQD